MRTDAKQRYTISGDGTRIRANHGHSVTVDPELEKMEPPEFLYHGTAGKNGGSILEKGILPMERVYVHISSDIETAIEAGRRHGNPAVFRSKRG